MKLESPFRLQSKLSKHSVLALAGLVLFAAIVIAANPFGVGTTNATTPGAGSGAGTGQGTGSAAQQGSLLTGAPSGHSGEHNNDDGESGFDP